jgi:hypothetical protein
VEFVALVAWLFVSESGLLCGAKVLELVVIEEEEVVEVIASGSGGW